MKSRSATERWLWAAPLLIFVVAGIMAWLKRVPQNVKAISEYGLNRPHLVVRMGNSSDSRSRPLHFRLVHALVSHDGQRIVTAQVQDGSGGSHRLEARSLVDGQLLWRRNWPREHSTDNAIVQMWWKGDELQTLQYSLWKQWSGRDGRLLRESQWKAKDERTFARPGHLTPLTSILMTAGYDNPIRRDSDGKRLFPRSFRRDAILHTPLEEGDSTASVRFEMTGALADTAVRPNPWESDEAKYKVRMTAQTPGDRPFAVVRFEAYYLGDGGSDVNVIASPDAKHLLVSVSNQYSDGPYHVSLFSTGLRKRVWQEAVERRWLRSAAFDPSGRFVALAFEEYNSKKSSVNWIELRDIRTGEVVRNVRYWEAAASFDVVGLTISNDGKYLLVLKSDRCEVWKLDDL